MSASTGETSVHSTVAAAYNLDRASNQWAPIDAGASHVFIFHNPTKDTYRVIGISVNTENYNINAPIFKGFVFKRVSEVFVQWRDTSCIYGLSFPNSADADQFVRCIEDIVKNLEANSPRMPAPPPGISAAQPHQAAHSTLSPSGLSHSSSRDGVSPRKSSYTPPPAVAGSPQRFSSPPGSINAEAAIATELAARGRGIPRRGAPPPRGAPGGPVGGIPPPVVGMVPRGRGTGTAPGSAPASATGSPMLSPASLPAPVIGSLSAAPIPAPISAAAYSSAPAAHHPVSSSAGVSISHDYSSSSSSSSSSGGSHFVPPVPGASHSGSFGPGSPVPEGVETYNLLTKPDELLTTRQKVIKEIFTTEKDYISKLTQLVKECYQPLLKGKFQNVFTPEDRKKIYGNVEIIESMNSRFLDNLKERLVNWYDGQQIGDVFKQMIPFFRVYKDYYNNYETGLHLLEKLSKKKEVKEYLKSCEAITNGHKLPFLLVTPVQRIPRYSLLVRELLKHTSPDHPDFSGLTTANEELQNFTMTLNKSVKETENIRKFSDLVKDHKRYIGFEPILAPHRLLLHESEVTVKVAEKVYTWMLLFSDLLVFASSSPSGKKKTVEEKLDLEKVWVEDLSEYGQSNMIRVVYPDKMYLVELQEESQKQIWLATAENATISWLTLKNKNFEGGTRKFTFQHDSGARYDGDWKDCKPHGSGTCHYPNGNIYDGGFQEGKRSGSGKMVYNKNGGVYEGEWKDDKPHGNGTLRIKGTEYVGEFSAGLKQGQGKITWTNGDYYEGQWFNNKMNGHGKLVNPHYTYEGEWESNFFHGNGVLTSEQGNYDGSWYRDRKCGNGTLTMTNGNVYKGIWKDDQLNGTGSFIAGDGSQKYEGDWENGRMNGNGILIVRSLYTYHGAFREDRKYGAGKQVFDNGTQYDGTWADDRKEGKGVWKGLRGEIYDGSWHSDKRFGRGKLTLADGSSYDGEWVNDRKEGKGTYCWPDGSKYSGTWTADKRHGRGVFTNADESVKYVGDWEDDMKSGRGILTDPSGSFEGDWKNDLKNGPGKLTLKDGVVIEGTWVNNEIDGSGTIAQNDGTSQEVFWREGFLDRPSVDTFPSPLPGIKSFVKLY